MPKAWQETGAFLLDPPSTEPATYTAVLPARTSPPPWPPVGHGRPFIDRCEPLRRTSKPSPMPPLDLWRDAPIVVQGFASLRPETVLARGFGLSLHPEGEADHPRRPQEDAGRPGLERSAEGHLAILFIEQVADPDVDAPARFGLKPK